MKNSMVLALLVACVQVVSAQTAEEAAREKAFRERAAKAAADSVPLGWVHNVVAGLTLTQISFSNWAQGGENALAYSVSVKGSSVHEAPTTQWGNAYKLAFGQTRLSNQGLRKTDDEIYFESLLIYKLGVHINPYASTTLRTQFAPGFKYEDDGTRTQLSRFFDPAYLTQSIGVAYKPVQEVTTRLGVAAREIVTSTYIGYSDDPDTPDKVEKFRIDGGLESVTDVDWKFAENMKLTSKLELFAPFSAMDEVIVRFDNAISASVNKYVTVLLNVTLINEKRVTPRTQVREVLALGLSYTLL